MRVKRELICACGAAGLYTSGGQKLFCPLSAPSCLCACGGAWAAACEKTGQVAVYGGARLKNIFFACPGVCGMLLRPWQNALYLLSGETDTVYRAALGTGEMEIGTRVGFGPRHLCQKEGFMAVAGGGNGQALVLDRQLHIISSADFDGCVWQCAFGTKGTIYVLCAVENGNVETAVYVWHGTEKRRLCCLPGLPGCVRLTGKALLVTTLNRLFCLDAHTGKIIWARGQPGLLKGLCITPGVCVCTDEMNEHLLCGLDIFNLRRLPVKNVKAAEYV